MTSNRPALALALPVLLLPPLLLSACSSASAGASAGTSTSASASAPAATSASTGAAASGAGGADPSAAVTTGDELCALVSVSDAQAAEQSSPAFTAQEGTTGSYDDPVCSYSNKAAATDVMVLIYRGGIVRVDTSKSYLNQTDASPVSGLGVKASASEHEVDVDLGGDATLIAYQPASYGTPRAGVSTATGLTALAKAFVAKLG